MSGDFNVTVEKLLLKWLPGITIASMKWIHQLDYATSGVLCIGLNRKAAAIACNAFEHRQVKKEYIAVLQGHIDMNRWKKKKIIDQDKEKFGSSSYKAPSDVNIEDSLNYGDSKSTNDDGRGNSIKKNNEWYNRENNTKCIDDSNKINDSMKSNINTYETNHDNHKRKISKLRNNTVVDIEIKHGNHFNQTISIDNDNGASNSLVMDDNNVSKSKQWQDEIMEKNLLICYDNFHAYLIKNGWKKIDQSIENDKVDNNDYNQRLIFDELKASDSKLYHEIEKLSKHGLEEYRRNSKLRKSLRKCLKSLKINTELIESNHLSFDSKIIHRDSNMNVENNSSSSGTDVVVDDIDNNNDDDDKQSKLLYSINIENVKKLQQMFSSAVTTDNKHGIPRIYRVNISDDCDISSTNHDHHLFDSNEQNDDHDHDSHIHPSNSNGSSISNNLCRIMIDIPIAEVKGKVFISYHTFSNHFSKYCNCSSR